MKIIVSGASGLIGRALTASLTQDGVEVVRLVRRAPREPDELEWLRDHEPLSPDALAGADAVVNLNGASIGRLPWTPAYRRILRSSRLMPTQTLADALRPLGADAPAFVSASAVGFYGDRGGQTVDESSQPGDTFLAQLCVDWENAAQRAGDHVRVALLRTAPVLHPQAVLKPMIRLTRLGLAGPLGSGKQIWPWVTLDDEVRAIRHIITAELSGPVNVAAPSRATANDVGRALAASLHRPFLVPAPAWALRLALGRAAADSLLLADTEVTPASLLASGFTFEHEDAQAAVRTAVAATSTSGL